MKIELKKCIKCEVEKSNSLFYVNNEDCMDCRDKKRAKQREYYEKNKNIILLQNAKSRDKNKEAVKIQKQIHYLKNREYYINANKLYAKNNKEKRNARNRNRYKTEPKYKIREIISKKIQMAFKSMLLKKDGSVMIDLDFSIIKIVEYIEKQFHLIGNEWMNWNNWGKYDPKTWDDNDSNTWKWQLDHIIPHSEFKYTSMKDEEFKKCWSLNNLRPYSAKLNILDGTSRIRHKKKINNVL